MYGGVKKEIHFFLIITSYFVLIQYNKVSTKILERAGSLMKFKNVCLLFILFQFFCTTSQAQEAYSSQHLTQQDIGRLRVVKELLDGVDKESLRTTIQELDKARHPQINLLMKEAMAKAYVDIVQSEGVQGLSKKEWLYSMICLNMAYLQFGGSSGKRGSTTELNRLIRKKLIQYLPPNALKETGFVYSLD